MGVLPLIINSKQLHSPCFFTQFNTLYADRFSADLSWIKRGRPGSEATSCPNSRICLEGAAEDFPEAGSYRKQRV